MTIIAIALLAAPPQATNGLDGAWETACLPIGKNGRHGVITHVTISNDTMEATAQVHATRACATPTFQIHFKGKIDEVAPGEPIPFKYKVIAIDLTPQNQAIVDQYNRADNERHGCGLTGWQLNRSQSVAGQECTPFHFARTGTFLYDNGWIDNDGKLSFGAFPMLWSNDAESKRPSKPLPVTYHPIRP
jgi:hypothetical protein